MKDTFSSKQFVEIFVVKYGIIPITRCERAWRVDEELDDAIMLHQ